MKFYLGTHQPNWLELTDVPLFISNRRLMKYKRLPVASGGWCLDSGGFSELSLYDRWVTTPEQYAALVRRYMSEVGNLVWAAPQDWMCEPHMLQKTGLTVAEHQRRTTESVVRLREMEPEAPWVPVLQGWDKDDYLRHIEMYDAAGISLPDERVVGLGSVCRRQHSDDIGEIVDLVAGLGVQLHGFGVKLHGLQKYGDNLQSSDSMAWSFDARRTRRPVLPGHTHKTCANCLDYALLWRARLLATLAHAPVPPWPTT